ncbi:unnamed protein product [Heterosigma akashiwo]|mmetsp:Transcript_38142/g.55965  ORF Transcript_38142/g.55965 Transcript_38142/m.55965 type:complete len:106 (-) Transcript_38142:113-430(-)
MPKMSMIVPSTLNLFPGFANVGFGFAGGAVRFMSKYLSKSARKRVPLSSKWGNKDYYKGNQCRKFGRINSRGRFMRDRSLDLHILVPDLTGFQLKPYVARTTPKK